MQPKKRSFSNKFSIIIPCEATYSLEVSARVSLKMATRVFSELKFRFLNYFSKAKTEKYDQKTRSAPDQIGIITTCSVSYHLEVNATVHWKQPPKPLYKVKKLRKVRFSRCFSKAKTDECYQKKLTWLQKIRHDYISAAYFPKVGARFPLKVATKASFGGRETLKIQIFRLLF